MTAVDDSAGTNEHVRLHAVAHGHVQGVRFRAETQHQARSLCLTGWVRNLPDGRSVEVLAEGPRAALHELVDLLRQGPLWALVNVVDMEWSQAEGGLPRPFQVKG